jgi:hypothetical protein
LKSATLVAIRQTFVRVPYMNQPLRLEKFWHAECLVMSAMLRTNSVRIITVSVACAAGLVAQDVQRPAAIPSQDDAANAAANPGISDQGGTPAPAQQPQVNDPPPPPPNGANAPNGNYGNIPATLTLPGGAFVTVRVNQWLSSDRSQVGDTFYATLVQPLIVNGVVVARKGSSVTGRVTEVKKSHVDGTSRLGLQLTSLSLVDGQQITIQSQVVDRNGASASGGSQAGAIAGGTAVGAGIGAVAGGGIGAGIGAGVGLVASSIGVVLTRGRPTEIYPESMLTFRTDAPVTVSTTQAPAAFHFAGQEDYGIPGTQTRMGPGPMGPMAPMGSAYSAYPAPYYPYPYPYYGPYYYGPGFGVFIGPGFYGRGFYGGFRGGFRR